MSLYAIGDLHLCLGAYKPMDVFGGRWEGYMDKLREVADGAEVVSDVVRFPDDEHRFDRDPDLAEEARRRACNWFDLHLR